MLIWNSYREEYHLDFLNAFQYCAKRPRLLFRNGYNMQKGHSNPHHGRNHHVCCTNSFYHERQKFFVLWQHQTPAILYNHSRIDIMEILLFPISLTNNLCHPSRGSRHFLSALQKTKH